MVWLQSVEMHDLSLSRALSLYPVNSITQDSYNSERSLPRLVKLSCSALGNSRTVQPDTIMNLVRVTTNASVTEVLLAELSGLSMLSNKVVCFLEILLECLCIYTCRRRRRVTRRRVEHEVDRETNLPPEHLAEGCGSSGFLHTGTVGHHYHRKSQVPLFLTLCGSYAQHCQECAVEAFN